ncbi:MAG: DedA family protein [Armatimonadota bacterium]|nr:DedA family protein [Armatimonadota bacterium]MDR7532520.1 DedA family protein [Armatimonadota bacterium]MDR7535590.1 DedA family protein [Armatimonadota bacterium]
MEFLARALDLLVHLDRHLGTLVQAYGVWAYPVLALVIFAETGLVVTPFLPGDSLLFAAGAIAARGGLNVWGLAALLAAAAIVGDAVNYWVGRALGVRLVAPGRTRYIRQEHLDRTHAFYERHGARTIVLARFVPIVRTFAPFVAGLGRMTYSRFTVYNVTGAALWVGIFVLGGYWFGNLPLAQRHLTPVLLGVIVVSLLPVGREVLRAWRGKEVSAGDR